MHKLHENVPMSYSIALQICATCINEISTPPPSPVATLYKADKNGTVMCMSYETLETLLLKP